MILLLLFYIYTRPSAKYTQLVIGETGSFIRGETQKRENNYVNVER